MDTRTVEPSVAAARGEMWQELSEFYTDEDNVRETKELLRNLGRVTTEGFIRGSRLG